MGKMFRRLLACFALISGLAATGAPVSVAAVEAATQRVVSGETTRQEAEARCKQNEQRVGNDERNGSDRRCKQRKSVTIYVPTVQIGSDVAYE